MSNSPAFIASHLSVLRCGGLVTVAKTSASRADLEQQIKETNSSFIFTDEDALDKLLRVAENCSNVKEENVERCTIKDLAAKFLRRAPHSG
ncbi:hypothetical protein NECAME_05774 [Necator americanus]|uniref:Alcohol dehydrogenase-like C-terminal domain-containing protein n=1 Tax=Necator americanus TaxID=51031 RepID=W2TYK4_NECAM|nr:hypothetical protein NECAME_05774 [Necator americanus]ETN86928.1 hypothetical protein NECAME_05774 [Necator americanus]